MSSIEHPKILFCFQHSQDAKVRMIIGNLVCGLFDASLYVSNGYIYNGTSNISIDSDPKALTLFISSSIDSDPSEIKFKPANKKRVVSSSKIRSFVLRESSRLGLRKDESIGVINTLTLAVMFKKILFSDLKMNNGLVVGIDGVSFNERALVLSSNLYT